MIIYNYKLTKIRRLMNNKYIVTNRHTNKIDYEFEGTEYQFALSLANLDKHIDIGYPDNIIKEYRYMILNDNIDEDRMPMYETAISDLEKMNKDSIAVVISNGADSFTVTDVFGMDDDFKVERHDLVQELEVSAEYFIDAVINNNKINDAKWSNWDSASEIIEVYKDDPRFKFVFVGGIDEVTKNLQKALADNIKIEGLVEAYENKSKPFKELLETVKTFNGKMIDNLENLLISKDIDIDKFSGDLKSSERKNKMKP